MSAPSSDKKRANKAIGVYQFIWDLICEGRDAHLRNHRGLFELNWPVVVRRYFDFQATKYPKRVKRFNPKKASNGLRAALLNFYKKDGAREIKQARKFGDNNEVVWRQFQMPPEIYRELQNVSGPVHSEGTSSEESGFEEFTGSSTAGSPQSAMCVDDDASQTSDSSGLFETTDVAGTPESSPGSAIAAHSRPHHIENSNDSLTGTMSTPENNTHEPCELVSSLMGMSETEFQLALSDVTSSDVEGLDLESSEKNLVSEIFPCRDSTKGGSRFSVTLAESLTPTVSTIVAWFGEVIGTVALQKTNEFTLSGTVPSAPKAGTVIVSIFTDGTYIGEAEFEYFDPMEEMIKLLVQNPKYLDVWAVQQLTKEHQWVNVTDVLRLAQPVNVQPDSGAASHTQLAKPVDVLQLMLYTAAKIGASQFVRVLFSTSAGRAVFNQYRDNATLPHNVAQANGHQELAQYLKEVHRRLEETDGKDDHGPNINWEEFRDAVRTSWETIGMQLASKEQEIDKPSSCSEHGSDYDGDGEGSSSLLSDDSSVAPIINHYHIHHHHHHIPAKISHDLAVQMVDLQHIGSKQDMETMVADASFSEVEDDVQWAADHCKEPMAKQPALYNCKSGGKSGEQHNHETGTGTCTQTPKVCLRLALSSLMLLTFSVLVVLLAFGQARPAQIVPTIHWASRNASFQCPIETKSNGSAMKATQHNTYKIFSAFGQARPAQIVPTIHWASRNASFQCPIETKSNGSAMKATQHNTYLIFSGLKQVPVSQTVKAIRLSTGKRIYVSETDKHHTGKVYIFLGRRRTSSSHEPFIPASSNRTIFIEDYGSISHPIRPLKSTCVIGMIKNGIITRHHVVRPIESVVVSIPIVFIPTVFIPIVFTPLNGLAKNTIKRTKDNFRRSCNIHYFSYDYFIFMNDICSELEKGTILQDGFLVTTAAKSNSCEQVCCKRQTAWELCNRFVFGEAGKNNKTRETGLDYSPMPSIGPAQKCPEGLPRPPHRKCSVLCSGGEAPESNINTSQRISNDVRARLLTGGLDATSKDWAPRIPGETNQEKAEGRDRESDTAQLEAMSHDGCPDEQN